MFREICYTMMLKKLDVFLYYFKETSIMIRLTIYQDFKEHTFDGDGHLEIIGEVEESNNVYMRVAFDKKHEQALYDFLYDVPSYTRCRVWDNDGRFFNGEYVTKSRIDKSPLVIVSKISQYI